MKIIFYIYCFLMIQIAAAAPTKIFENYEGLDQTNLINEKSQKIRQCTCSEADECVSEAYPSLKECRKSCKSYLEYFGAKTNDYVECWPSNPAGKDLLISCLKKNIDGFCTTNSSISYIDKPEYNQTAIEEEDESNFEMAKHFKAFHYCAGACLKEKIVACYERKSCGVLIPQNYDIGKPANFCEDLKSTVVSNTFKAYACIAFSQFFG
uniref:Uncharacterized protein n=1 Tax=Panagrolaimus superbus TaxID=310955 RepID=A0A914YUN8_9BILA